MMNFSESIINRELLCIKKRLALLDPSGKGISGKLIDVYLEFTESRLMIVLKSIGTLDWVRVQRELHDLKSTSLNLGAESLGEQFRSLEEFRKAEFSEEFSAALAVTTKNYELIALAMRKHFVIKPDRIESSKAVRRK